MHQKTKANNIFIKAHPKKRKFPQRKTPSERCSKGLKYCTCSGWTCHLTDESHADTTNILFCCSLPTWSRLLCISKKIHPTVSLESASQCGFNVLDIYFTPVYLFKILTIILTYSDSSSSDYLQTNLYNDV